jgi:hypothetical protein
VLGVDGYNPSIIQYNVPPTGAAANAGERRGVGSTIMREYMHCVAMGWVVLMCLR